MITAKEARIKANSINNEMCIKPILEAIDSAVNLGKYSISTEMTGFTNIDKIIKHTLENAGFIVDIDFNKGLFKINW